MNLFKKICTFYLICVFTTLMALKDHSSSLKIDYDENQRQVPCGKTKAEKMCEKYAMQTWNLFDLGHKISERILGGSLTEPKQFPHMTDIGYTNRFHPDSISWLCGGSLISENFILSAAHCTETQYPSWVRFDEPKKYNYKVTKIIIHPRYNRKIFQNDIVLLEFEGLREFTDYIRPICLNVLEHIPARMLTAVGWGQNGHDKKRSDQLLAVELEQHPNSECSSKYNIYDERLSICAGCLSGGKDTCPGDSGGPLQYTQNITECFKVPAYILVGITSYGMDKCGTPNMPGVYTRVSRYISWIEEFVWR